MSKLKAALFDIDGTLMDNNEYHKMAWMQYLEGQGKKMSDEEFKKNVSGRTNLDAVQRIYGKEMSDQEASKYYLAKEEIYRKLYQPYISPIHGLLEFLKDLQDHGIVMVIATSGIQVNIDFMFEHIPIKQYFKEVIQSKDITKGKPDPEIFTKAAQAGGFPPENCVVFEDSLAGVKAAKKAGIKVVALTTSEEKKDLKKADLVIKNYNEINCHKLTSLI
jgi:beta-phosphoglucomutase